ncbi:tRNA (adenosine(37)-N6)-threonylcarbamoyltransferase complex ATPase subunit type 1 TsaE [Patescibacteria group bacterium]|nr:tRNA (adenosine(37)-N6)-threonylcarbamoyltransferase complex ATPase subunit type 1 TsaE [Patescibacteria group bacterium]MBU0879655.1 tRNA (adenosine(37)-N6)-threonylcarbamoyltransferase complex ATPase subunit type 1 TsaE [Patescibacteria group bacterium]MBU0880548.1 tRNA (adenosine(37)-N6)-threonylcarbamoyltransferase complex ATPase subunit type 1 TsaE [Patescibacteria group bacterium]MBU0898026.1 tRNA (adenosine(37)-N6)-threonylcarbamoyltransferase complex ATPase subunit type 1 TsaE [Patesc
MKYYTKTAEETLALAKKFAKELKGGEIIGLIGNLGAGKTLFTKGIAIKLGIKKSITSPTFVLMKIYPVNSHEQIKFLVHIDAYRIKSANDLIAIGANEHFDQPDTVTIIEWADKIKKILPKKTKFIKITIDRENRIINV